MEILDHLIALESRPFYAVLIPFTASCLVFVLGRIARYAGDVITLIASVVMSFLVCSMAPAVLAEAGIKQELFAFSKGVSFAFSVDTAGMIFACTASVLWILVAVYTAGYMQRTVEKHPAGYYAAVALCMSAIQGLCFAANLITFFLFYVVLMAAAYPLVVHSGDEAGKAAGRKYLVYFITSGLLFCAAIIIVYKSAGTLEFTLGGFLSEGMLPAPWTTVLFFMMAAAGIVSAGIIPLQSWLPAAASAPAPACILLNALATVNAGAFCIFRVVFFVFGPALARSCRGTDILAWMAVITILISSLIAMRKNDLMESLSYSTMGQVSYIVLGICILTPFSTAGALFDISAHSFLNSILFMTAGAVCASTHRKDIAELSGAGKRMPVTMTAFSAASFGLAGFPLFAGFVGKANILLGAVEKGKPVFASVMIAGALLTIASLMPVVIAAFRKENDDYSASEEAGAGLCMLIPVILTVIISILLGILPDIWLRLFDMSLMTGNAIFAPLM